MTLRLRQFAALLLTGLLAAPQAAEAGRLILSRDFIERHKKLVTITVNFSIEKPHKSPNSPKKDGDLHLAGRSSQVGLPMVAEIMNAKTQPTALKFVKKHTDKPAVPLVGVWRLWFEHPPGGNGEQRQFDPVDRPKDPNPKHMFEIHPVTKIGEIEIQATFKPIEGYEAWDAQTAFKHYESRMAIIQPAGEAVVLISKRALYNYAEFRIALTKKPEHRDDGLAVMAIVKDVEGTTVVDKPRRMVFVAGTEPANKVKNLKKGAELHVLGIPRVSLEGIAELAKVAGPHGKEFHLPYEMIIVAVIPEP